MSGRIRTIKPEWNEDERLIMCSTAARTLSVSFMLLADDQGNGRFVPMSLAPRLFPAYPHEFMPAVAELMSIGYLALYRVDGQTYFSIRSWAKHQRIDNAGKPRVPPLEGAEILGEPPQLTTYLAETRREIPRARRTPAATRRVSPLDPDPDPDPDPEEEEDQDHDPISHGLKKQEASPKSPSAPSGVALVRDAYLAGFRHKYKREGVWGARSAGQAKALLSEWSAYSIVSMLQPRMVEDVLRDGPFFAWRNADVIKATHPFGKGPHSLVMRIHELDGDMHNHERRAVAAAAQDRERTDNRTAANQDQAQRVAEKIIQRQQEQARGQQELPDEPSSQAVSRDLPARRDAQPPTLGRGAGDVGREPDEVSGPRADHGAAKGMHIRPNAELG